MRVGACVYINVPPKIRIWCGHLEGDSADNVDTPWGMEP